jgi:hypothetical protein
VISSVTCSGPSRAMKSVMNVLADCEVYQSVIVMKPLNQKIQPLLNDNVPDL